MFPNHVVYEPSAATHAAAVLSPAATGGPPGRKQPPLVNHMRPGVVSVADTAPYIPSSLLFLYFLFIPPLIHGVHLLIIAHPRSFRPLNCRVIMLQQSLHFQLCPLPPHSCSRQIIRLVTGSATIRTKLTLLVALISHVTIILLRVRASIRLSPLEALLPPLILA